MVEVMLDGSIALLNLMGIILAFATVVRHALLLWLTSELSMTKTLPNSTRTVRQRPPSLAVLENAGESSSSFLIVAGLNRVLSVRLSSVFHLTVLWASY